MKNLLKADISRLQRKNVKMGKIKHLFHTNVLNKCMKQLFGKSAQALFGKNQNS
jgi:hypothetical protein